MRGFMRAGTAMEGARLLVVVFIVLLLISLVVQTV
jgi:uncharacterized membrane protein YtjA (UPF0391 family)